MKDKFIPTTIIMLYNILKQVAEAINIEVGNMNLTIKSAHIYDKDREKIDNILENIKNDNL